MFLLVLRCVEPATFCCCEDCLLSRAWHVTCGCSSRWTVYGCDTAVVCALHTIAVLARDETHNQQARDPLVVVLSCSYIRASFFDNITMNVLNSPVVGAPPPYCLCWLYHTGDLSDPVRITHRSEMTATLSLLDRYSLCFSARAHARTIFCYFLYQNMGSARQLRHVFGVETKGAKPVFNLSPLLTSLDGPILAASSSFWAAPWTGGGGPVYVSTIAAAGKVYVVETIHGLWSSASEFVCNCHSFEWL